jgi:hypothetical protein
VALEGVHVCDLAGVTAAFLPPPPTPAFPPLRPVLILPPAQVKRVGVQALDDPNLSLPFAHDRNIPVIVTAHPALLLRPTDWERWIHVCGPAVLPAPSDWQPSDELNEFITRGLPPIYISFGSCLQADAEALTALAIDAAQTAGLRAIIDTTFEGVFAQPRRMPQVPAPLLPTPPPPLEKPLPDVFVVCNMCVAGERAAARLPGGGEHQHRRSDQRKRRHILRAEPAPRRHAAALLPLRPHGLHAPNKQVAAPRTLSRAIVSSRAAHGRGSALWAGIPSVTVPFIFDSRFWADRLHAIGAAAAPLPIESLTAPGLAAAIKEVAGSSSIKKAAESLKQGLVDHNGAASCANLLRRILHRPWDRSVMEVQRPRSSPPRSLTLLLCKQVLPRRKGDLWIHVSSIFFKTWERRHSVIDGAHSSSR